MNLKSIVILSAFATAGAANAVTLASWNFDTTTVSGTASKTVGPIAANSGSGSASGTHASASTVYSTPAGNGSAKSLSSNGWAVGDYYQFTTTTTGFGSLGISFDEAGSGTGPKSFKVAYSTNGTSFTDLTSGAYTVALSNWSAGTPQAGFGHTFNLSSVTALNNLSTVYIRLIDTSSATTGSINGAAVGTAGTDRVDNFTFTGTAQPVPEPTTLAALGLGAVAVLRRRRKA